MAISCDTATVCAPSSDSACATQSRNGIDSSIGPGGDEARDLERGDRAHVGLVLAGEEEPPRSGTQPVRGLLGPYPHMGIEQEIHFTISQSAEVSA